MKRIILTAFLATGLYSMERAPLVPQRKQSLFVKMPNAPLLAEQLATVEMDEFKDFVAMSGLACRIAEKEYAPAGLAFAIEMAMLDYIECIDQPYMLSKLKTYKGILMRRIFKDHPDAIEQLIALKLIDNY